jgi:hypothetical protein
VREKKRNAQAAGPGRLRLCFALHTALHHTKVVREKKFLGLTAFLDTNKK